MSTAVKAPATVDEFMQLNPAQRLRLAQSLGCRVTPQIVALVIYTYLNTPMSSQTRKVYYDAVIDLMGKARKLDVYMLSYWLINTSTATGEFLEAHQQMGNALEGLRATTNWQRGYLQRRRTRNGEELFTGTPSRRILPLNSEELRRWRAKEEDLALYGRVSWHRGTGRAQMILVPKPDPGKSGLPSTLGLA